MSIHSILINRRLPESRGTNEEAFEWRTTTESTLGCQYECSLHALDSGFGVGSEALSDRLRCGQRLLQAKQVSAVVFDPENAGQHVYPSSTNRPSPSYQGFSNAKFGRIECHEAINAFAREILLTAKEHLEAGGWRVLHGIVDSIWVTPDPAVEDTEREPLETIAADVTETVEIRLEYEAEYEWVAFVPQRNAETGALTKYFGTVACDDQLEPEFKLRGIEARQRSTPPFVERVQRECLACFDETRSPDAVLGRLERAIERLHAGEIDVEQLVERNRVSKPLDAYSQYTQNVAALERAREHDLDIQPGQDVAYVVVDDQKDSRERVALAHENSSEYDASYYETQLLRAVESILAPLGWDRADIEQTLAETQETGLGR